MARLMNAELPKAFLDGTGPGWKALAKDDFAKVNPQRLAPALADAYLALKSAGRL